MDILTTHSSEQIEDGTPHLSMLDHAQALATRGFYVFPITPNKKAPPLITEFSSAASRNAAQIMKWWRQWPEANVGISTSRFEKSDALLVIDVDTKKDGKGNLELVRLELEGFDLPSTTQQTTPTGGRHIIYRVSTPVRQGTNVLGKNLDVRSKGGYIVGAGSRTELGTYQINTEPISAAPPWVIERCGAPHDFKDKSQAVLSGINTEQATSRVIAYLKTEAPLAIQGSGGDDTTFKVAARCKDLGVQQEECAALMLEFWNPRCSPPWEVSDLERKVRHAYRYGTEPVGVAAPEVEFSMLHQDDTTKYDFKMDWTDTGNANVLVNRAEGRLRFIPETKTWLHWTSGHWERCDTRSVARRYALRVAEFYHLEASKLTDAAAALDGDGRKKHEKSIEHLNNWERTCRSKKSLDAMLDLASTHRQVELSIAKLNTHATLLGVLNGVVDLRTGKLREAAQMEYITIACPFSFDPMATAPTWEQTIAEVTGLPGSAPHDYTPRPDVAAFLQRVLGYALTGLIREHKMFFFNGSGSNGKNVVADAVRYVLGDYSTGLPSSCLLQTKHVSDGERPTPFAADLFRKRFVVASETKAGFKLDTDFVKSQTGDTWQKARYMRENPFEFESTHKLFLMTNAMPEIDHLDEAIRGRLIVIPFERTWNRPNHPDPDPSLPNADATLPERLRGEAQGILKWLVDGAVAYFQHGLSNAPAAVKGRTQGYLTEQDTVAQWLDERCERCEHKDGETRGALAQDYTTWARENGRTPMSLKGFSMALKSRRFETKDLWRNGRSQKCYPLKLKGEPGNIYD